jgi:hypothetical protein
VSDRCRRRSTAKCRMNIVDRGRDGGHLCQRRDPDILQHRTAERVDANLLWRRKQSFMIKTVFDWRDRRKLAVTSVAPA